MKIRLKTPKGFDENVDVADDATLGQLRQAAALAVKFAPSSRVKLIHKGKILAVDKDASVLQEFNVAEGSVVIVTSPPQVRLR